MARVGAPPQFARLSGVAVQKARGAPQQCGPSDSLPDCKKLVDAFTAQTRMAGYLAKAGKILHCSSKSLSYQSRRGGNLSSGVRLGCRSPLRDIFLPPLLQFLASGDYLFRALTIIFAHLCELLGAHQQRSMLLLAENHRNRMRDARNRWPLPTEPFCGGIGQAVATISCPAI